MIIISMLYILQSQQSHWLKKHLFVPCSKNHIYKSVHHQMKPVWEPRVVPEPEFGWIILEISSLRGSAHRYIWSSKNPTSTHLQQKRLHRGRAKPAEWTWWLLSLQPDGWKPAQAKSEWLRKLRRAKKKRQSQSQPPLGGFIWEQGRLQTPRSGTKYQISSQWLTWGAGLWQQPRLLLTHGAHLLYQSRGAASDWLSDQWNGTIWQIRLLRCHLRLDVWLWWFHVMLFSITGD